MRVTEIDPELARSEIAQNGYIQVPHGIAPTDAEALFEGYDALIEYIGDDYSEAHPLHTALNRSSDDKLCVTYYKDTTKQAINPIEIDRGEATDKNKIVLHVDAFTLQAVKATTDRLRIPQMVEAFFNNVHETYLLAEHAHRIGSLAVGTLDIAHAASPIDDRQRHVLRLLRYQEMPGLIALATDHLDRGISTVPLLESRPGLHGAPLDLVIPGEREYDEWLYHFGRVSERPLVHEPNQGMFFLGGMYAYTRRHFTELPELPGLLHGARNSEHSPKPTNDYNTNPDYRYSAVFFGNILGDYAEAIPVPRKGEINPAKVYDFPQTAFLPKAA